MKSTQMLDEPHLLPDIDLSRIDGKRLYYPCAGGDLLTPVKMFSPTITTFFFVDRAYFCPGHHDMQFDEDLNRTVECNSPLLAKDSEHRLLSTSIVSEPALKHPISRL